MRKRFLSLLGAAAVAGAAVAGTALAETVQVGNLILTVDGSFSPTTLPKKEMAPVELRAEGHVTTDDGSIPPVAKTVVVDFDKNGTVVTKGIEQCDPKKLQNTTTAQARRKCKDALVGTGVTRAIVDFPDQDPFEAKGPLLAFNGKPKGKNPVIVFHVLANVPLPTTFVVPSVIGKSPKAGYGKRVTAQVPPIAGGNGRLVDFDVKISKKPATGKEYLLAKCTNGRFLADTEVTMLNGDKLQVGIVRDCKSK